MSRSHSPSVSRRLRFTVRATPMGKPRSVRDRAPRPTSRARAARATASDGMPTSRPMACRSARVRPSSRGTSGCRPCGPSVAARKIAAISLSLYRRSAMSTSIAGAGVRWQMETSRKPAQRHCIPLQNYRRVDIVVRIPEPPRCRPDIGEARPLLTLPAVRKDAEIELRESGPVGALRLIGNPLVLDRAFVVALQATDHEGDVRPLAEVLAFPGSAERVEHDLKVVGNGDAHDRALWRAARVDGALHGVATAAQEGQQRGTCDGHGNLGRAAHEVPLIPACRDEIAEAGRRRALPRCARRGGGSTYRVVRRYGGTPHLGLSRRAACWSGRLRSA